MVIVCECSLARSLSSDPKSIGQNLVIIAASSGTVVDLPEGGQLFANTEGHEMSKQIVSLKQQVAELQAKLDTKNEAKLNTKNKAKLDAKSEADLNAKNEAKLNAKNKEKLNAKNNAELDAKNETKPETGLNVIIAIVEAIFTEKQRSLPTNGCKSGIALYCAGYARRARPVEHNEMKKTKSMHSSMGQTSVRTCKCSNTISAIPRTSKTFMDVPCLLQSVSKLTMWTMYSSPQ